MLSLIQLVYFNFSKEGKLVFLIVLRKWKMKANRMKSFFVILSYCATYFLFEYKFHYFSYPLKRFLRTCKLNKNKLLHQTITSHVIMNDDKYERCFMNGWTLIGYHSQLKYLLQIVKRWQNNIENKNLTRWIIPRLALSLQNFQSTTLMSFSFLLTNWVPLP